MEERKLDRYDRAILEVVQRDNRLTNAELGRRVHLSESAVRRRLARLRGRGVIQADVSIVDAAEALVTIIVMVWFRDETVEGIRKFRQRMIDAGEVSQCYSVTGEADYLLVVHAPNLQDYDVWGKRTLLADPSVQRYDSYIVWSRVKFSTALPFPLAEARSRPDSFEEAFE